MIEKALAYVTRTSDNAGHDLLVFTHPFHPEAGVQVPGGTIASGETPEQAILREIREESGLEQVRLVEKLGVGEVSMAPFGRNELHRRHVFHAELTGPAMEQWRHFERDPSGGGGPIALDFIWRPVADPALSLIAGQDELLPLLRKRLRKADAPTD